MMSDLQTMHCFYLTTNNLHACRRRFAMLAFGFACTLSQAFAGEIDIDFVKDIQPIFEEHCLHCLGEEEQESAFRLDRRASLLKGDFTAKNPPNNLRRPSSLSIDSDRATVELLKRLNARHLEKYPGDANLAGRIASYELAGKMQTSVPDVMDLSGETEATLKGYGVEGCS